MLQNERYFGFFYMRKKTIQKTGWPKKNATLTINIFKKTRDRMKKCTLSRIKFFSQQDDTKNANFDEDVLILWPIFWCNVISKICTSISKVTIYVPKIFHCLAFPGEVCVLLLCKAKPAWIKHWLSNFAALQSGGATQRNSYLPQTWLLIQKEHIKKMTLPQKIFNEFITSK